MLSERYTSVFVLFIAKKKSGGRWGMRSKDGVVGSTMWYWSCRKEESTLEISNGGLPAIPEHKNLLVAWDISYLGILVSF